MTEPPARLSGPGFQLNCAAEHCALSAGGAVMTSLSRTPPPRRSTSRTSALTAAGAWPRSRRRCGCRCTRWARLRWSPPSSASRRLREPRGAARCRLGRPLAPPPLPTRPDGTRPPQARRRPAPRTSTLALLYRPRWSVGPRRRHAARRRAAVIITGGDGRGVGRGRLDAGGPPQ